MKTKQLGKCLINQVLRSMQGFILFKAGDFFFLIRLAFLFYDFIIFLVITIVLTTTMF